MRVNHRVYQSDGEEGLVARGTNPPDPGYVQEPIVSESTPFFHVDLIAAVRAAEKLGFREEEENESGESGPNGTPRDEFLIDLRG